MRNQFSLHLLLDYFTKCAPAFSKPNQKVHGLFLFYIAVICKTDQNQLKRPSVIGLPKFTSMNLVEKCHQQTIFSIENQFFEDYCFGSLMTDDFFQLILICLINICNIKVKKFMDFLVWIEKTRNAL